ncbi:MAG: hypothetical protein IJX77_05875 [Ruminococcus sp.]|nr:hypothetical protein [Ruminococcus sp.]
MKKTLAMLLAMLTVCSFTACGASEEKKSADSSSSSVAEEKTEAETEPEAEETSSDSEKETEEAQQETDDSESRTESQEEEPESEPEETDAAEAEETAAAEEEDTESDDYSAGYATDFADFEFGTVTDNVYTSSFSGLKFTAPDGYVFSTQEEILESMNIASDLIGGEKGELYQEVAEQASVYDMVAKNAATGESVAIMYENLNAYGEGYSDLFDVPTYVETLVTQFEGLASSGFIYEKIDEKQVNLGGREFTKVEFSCEYSGYSTTQAYYLAKDGNYMTIVLIQPGVGGGISSASELEPSFTPYTGE